MSTRAKSKVLPQVVDRLRRLLLGGLVVAMLATTHGWSLIATAAEGHTLWQMGGQDRDDAEFALAPNQYSDFLHDGFFAVGQSHAERDWPYVHPGPLDGWAGNRRHTFRVLFGLKSAAEDGTCRLHCDLVDTHRQSPPQLQIEINGNPFRLSLPSGAGDASVFGQPSLGKPHSFDLPFPAKLLRAGTNEIAITTVSGSWMLYDALSLEVPDRWELTAVSGTRIGTIESPPVLVDESGQLRQILRCGFRHLGDPTEATVFVDGVQVATRAVDASIDSLEVTVPAVEEAKEIAVRIDVAGQTLVTEAVRLQPVRKWVIYLLPHSHVDIGYTHVQTDVEHAQWQYLETAIETARRSADFPEEARFKWNVEVLWAVDSYLQQATDEQRQAFVDAVQAGQIGLQALYGNQLTGLCRPEELLRLLQCAQRISQTCDRPIRSAMITDVPGYTWGIVPALVHSGVKYFSVGPNGGARIGRTSMAWGDKPFWWIGPNGRDRVLVWMTGTGYYQVFQSPERLLDYLQRLGDQDYPYDYVQVRHCLGDNAAPDVEFPNRVKQWNAKYAYPQLVIATTEKMFRDFEQRYGDQLPTVQGDFTPYWEDGAASSARDRAEPRIGGSSGPGGNSVRAAESSIVPEG